jgi:hypothetical protein
MRCVRSPRNGDKEIRLLRHIALHGGGRSLGIRNEAGAAGRLCRFQSFCRNAPPSTIDHEGEAAAIHDDCDDVRLGKARAGKPELLTEYGNDPRSDEGVRVYKLANTLFVPA